MFPQWFKKRTYRHLDSPVGLPFIKKTESAKFIADHCWAPFISYIKRTKRYKPSINKTKFKNRDIMYASHRDACILSRYSNDLALKLEDIYKERGISDNVVAYRKLGRSNYHFSGDVIDFVRKKSKCVVYCFDVTDFFGSIDHFLLKRNIKEALRVEELPDDWFSVFKNITKYRHIKINDLKNSPAFSDRINKWSPTPIGTILEVVQAAVPIQKNKNPFGIPQGSPISATLSNLYMLHLDEVMSEICENRGGLYRRYSDDILIVVDGEFEGEIIAKFGETIKNLKLVIQDDKTERVEFDLALSSEFQYLGFQLSSTDAVMRPSSIGKQWRRARRQLREIKRIGEKAIETGTATKIFTKKLTRRFLPIGIRNFSRYARNASDSLQSKTIRRQVARLERYVRAAIESF